ncbi:hypothetical protein C8R43DRAFT_942564 [Mycena crocata]|nr:hypothetical protein C8R43DRAFT_942564 [Mycena crocata]
MPPSVLHTVDLCHGRTLRAVYPECVVRVRLAMSSSHRYERVGIPLKHSSLGFRNAGSPVHRQFVSLAQLRLTSKLSKPIFLKPQLDGRTYARAQRPRRADSPAPTLDNSAFRLDIFESVRDSDRASRWTNADAARRNSDAHGLGGGASVHLLLVGLRGVRHGSVGHGGCGGARDERQRAGAASGVPASACAIGRVDAAMSEVHMRGSPVRASTASALWEAWGMHARVACAGRSAAVRAAEGRAGDRGGGAGLQLSAVATERRGLDRMQPRGTVSRLFRPYSRSAPFEELPRPRAQYLIFPCGRDGCANVAIARRLRSPKRCSEPARSRRGQRVRKGCTKGCAECGMYDRASGVRGDSAQLRIMGWSKRAVARKV